MAIATLEGVALAPGSSKNGRRYTPDVIARAYTRLSTRLADPNGRPVTMRSHHPDPKQRSDRDVTRIAGRVTEVSLDEDGKLRWKGELVETAAGKDIAVLTTPEHPVLDNVSIRGWWVGRTWRDPRTGEECGEDVEIDGLDFTDFPGLDEARIETAELTEDRQFITESAEDVTVTIDEAAETPGSHYADPGYQKDKVKRYPLDTKAHVRAAWSYINQADNQKPYTAAQIKRIKGRIKSAAAKFGVKITEESVAQVMHELTEAFISGLPDQITEAMANVSVSNGPADISASAYGNDPADLKQVVSRLADAVLAALDAVDPDGDGDIDLPDDADGGAGWTSSESGSPDDDAMETASDSAAPATGDASTEKEAIVAETNSTETPADFAGVTKAASPHGGTPAVTETVTETVAAEETSEAPARNFTDADLAALAELIKPEAPVATTESTDSTTTGEVTETASMLTVEEAREMAKQAVAEAAASMKAEITEEAVALIRSGGRKGVVRPTDESGAEKPLHEMSEDERNAYAAEAWSAVLSRPAV